MEIFVHRQNIGDFERLLVKAADESVSAFWHS